MEQKCAVHGTKYSMLAEIVHCEELHCSFAEDHDLIVVLVILDQVRGGFFQAFALDTACVHLVTHAPP